MRLICPNCNAQYEVDDDVIPGEGRDVQCSNCGHAWFQPGAYADDAAEPDDAPQADTASAGADADSPEEEAADITADAAGAVDDAAGDAPEDDGPDDGPDDDEPNRQPAVTAAPVAPDRQRRMPDEAAMSLLREEAAREVEARRAEGSPLEMQPDLGLPLENAADTARAEADLATTAAIARIVPDRDTDDAAAHERDGDSDDPGDGPAARGPRRGLLPDIEVINSTLSATRGRGASEAASDDGTYQTQQNRTGFRRGFSLALLVTCLLLALYVMAPSIASKVPAAAPALDSYVGMVNRGRVWLDEKMKSSTEALRGTDGQGG